MNNIYFVISILISTIIFNSCAEKKGDIVINNYYYYDNEEFLWEHINRPAKNWIDYLSVNDKDEILVIDQMHNNVYISKDKGNSWNNLTSGLKGPILKSIINQKNEIIVYTSNNSNLEVFKTSDEGSTWARIFDTIPGLRKEENLLFCDSDSRGNIYAVCPINLPYYYSPGKLSALISTDNGKSWKPILDSIPYYSGFVIGIDDKLYCKYSGGQDDPATYIVTSSDWGSSWNTSYRLEGNIQCYLFQDNNGYLFIDCDYNSERWYIRYISIDKGKTWDLCGSNGLHNEYVYNITVSKKGNIYLSSEYGVYRSKDLGQNWTQIIKSQDRDVIKICLDSKGYLYALIGGDLHRSKMPLE